MTDSALPMSGNKPEETARVGQIISEYDGDLRGPIGNITQTTRNAG